MPSVPYSRGKTTRPLPLPIPARFTGAAAMPAGSMRHDRYSRNAIKARFCCADQAAPVFDVDSDLIILHTNGGAALSPVRTPGTMNNYDDLTKTTTYSRGGASVPFMDTTPIEAPALVLVSHGRSRQGCVAGQRHEQSLQHAGFRAGAAERRRRPDISSTVPGI